MTDPRSPLDKVSPELRLQIAIEQAVKRNLPLPPLLRAQVYGDVAGERGLVTYKTFREFVQARNPSLMRFEHIELAIPTIERICTGELTRVLAVWPTQYLKALADDTPIATPAGWTMMGQLQLGDFVFGSDGKPTKVLAVQHWADAPAYAVTAADGETIIAAADHLWKVRESAATAVVRTTQDLAENGMQSRVSRKNRSSGFGKKRTQVRIPLCSPLELPEIDLPITPYALGLWLGDGATAFGSICIGDQDASEIRARLALDGWDTIAQSRPPVGGPNACSYRLMRVGGRKWNRQDSFQSALRRAGLLFNKHIPEKYLRASATQRRALLQGLIDSDGTVSPVGQVSFGNTNERLARKVQELVWTLGARADLYTPDPEKYQVWGLGFFLEEAAGLTRKAERCHAPVEPRNNRPIVFQPVPPCNMTCIAVENPDGLFLAGRSLMVTHNSELFSRLLPAYYLLKHPSRVVALASYGADLAWQLSSDARDHYSAAGGKFKEGSARGTTRNWRTVRMRGLSGGMWAAGLGGQYLGKGWNLGIVDDPLDPRQVRSRAYQRRWASWWPGQWLRGERPSNSAMMFVQQRLASDDPVGWLLEKEDEAVKSGDLTAAHKWHILAFDEIKSNEPFAKYDGPRGFPSSCTVEPDPRKVGDALSPTWRSMEVIKRMHAQSDAATVSAQRQQRPMSPTGEFWRLEYFEDRVFDTLPKDAYNLGWDWDTAYSKEEANSASAGIQSARGPGPEESFPVYVNDVDWDWLEFPDLVLRIKAKTGPHYVEKKASGKSVVQTLLAYGVSAHEVPVTGDKLARASAAQPAAANHRVYISRRAQQKLLYAEGQGLLRVTAEALQEGGECLDVNDAFVQAIWRHLRIWVTRKKKMIAG